MRRIIPRRPTAFLSSFCAAVDGGRATIAAAVDGGRATIAATLPIAGDESFITTDPKPNVRTPHTDIFGVFVGQSAWAITSRKQLKNEESARKAIRILFRNYGGRAIQDKSDKPELSEEELDEFLTNLSIECETDHEKYIVHKEFYELIVKMTEDDTDDELGDATQNDRVDKLAEIAADEDLDALITNSFVTNLMIECEPKYEKRFREIIEKVRKKMIQDDRILEAFELVTDLMSKCEPEYEKLHCEVLEKLHEKIAHQDDKGGNENIRKIEILTKLDMNKWDIFSLEEELDKVVTGLFLKNLRSVEENKSNFMAYEVIEKVAKKVGNENVRKIAEKKLDALVTDSFAFQTVEVHINIPHFKSLRLLKIEREFGGRATQDKLDEKKLAKTNTPKLSEEELDVFLTNLAIECQMDHEKYEIVREEFHEVIEEMTQDDELGDVTQNDRVDKLAEIAAEEELDAFVTNSFITKLMIECDPKYEKRFRDIIKKVRKKMIQDDGILASFELATNLMNKCEPEYESLLREVLEEVSEKITQDDKGENDNISKIEKLAKVDMKAGKMCGFEEKLDNFVTKKFLRNLRDVEKEKSYFMSLEVIEKVAKKLGNENVRKIAEKKLDAHVTNLFVIETVGVQMNIPYFKLLRLVGARGLDEADE